MGRGTFRTGLACWSLFVMALSFCVVRPAAAQNIVNQTTCGGATGTNSCVNAGGFLQDLIVDCSAPAPAGLVNTALAQITDRSGPNRITVFNTCNVGVNITGFNRLTIQGDGATLTRGWNIVNSRNITLRSLTFDLSQAAGNSLNFSGSQAVLDGVVVRNSNVTGVNLLESAIGFGAAPSTITSNGAGINVGAGSFATLANVTISNNGLQGVVSQPDGVHVTNGGAVTLASQVNVGGSLTDALLDISGNAGHGIALGGGSLATAAENGAINIHIHHNTDTGLEVAGPSVASVEGHVQFDNNHMTSNDPFFPFPLQIDVALGGTLGIGEGTSVQGGLAAAFKSSVAIGDGGATSITGGATFAYGSVGLVGNANTIDALVCDGTSWVVNQDNSSAIGTNTCPSSGPTGTQGPVGQTGLTGPQGPQGLQGQQGVPGVSGRQVVVSSSTQAVPKGSLITVVASCPAGKAVVGGGASTTSTNLSLMSEGPSSTTDWTVRFENITTKSQSATVTATAICAVAQ